MLPDNRGWELVTSGQTSSAALIEPISREGVVQTSTDGEPNHLLRHPPPLVADAQGETRGPTSALSIRGAEEWSTRDIVPPEFCAVRQHALPILRSRTGVFSSDLSRSIVDPFRAEPLLLATGIRTNAVICATLNDVACSDHRKPPAICLSRPLRANLRT